MFDRLIRYLPVLDYIEKYHPQKILEVGSGAKGLGEFCKAEFTGVDLHRDSAEFPVHNMTFVQSSASKLPFSKGEFDLIVCIDVLEHVSEKERGKVMEEMMRVCFGRNGSSDNGCEARIENTVNVKRQTKRASLPFSDYRKIINRTVIIGFPCGRGAEKLSKKMHNWFKKRGSATARWMREHAEFGLPSENYIFSVGAYNYKPHGVCNCKPLQITEINNENLHVCEWLLRLEENGRWLKLEKFLYRHFRPLVEFFLRRGSFACPQRLARLLGLRGGRGRCYRKIWIIDKT